MRSSRQQLQSTSASESLSVPPNTGSAAISVAMDEKVRHLERLASLGTLSASFAHEIRNALVPVRTFVELLLDQNKDAELADTVRREIIRIDGIVSHMLRLSANQRTAQSDFGMHELLTRLLRTLEPQLSARSIRLKTDFQAAADTIRGDPQQIDQIFLNLFLNALDAMGNDGELTVRTALLSRSKGGRKIHITVSDTGHGISAEHLPRLFEPFFTTKPHGTGLGLAITHQIIDLHGGKISVESDPGKGSVFHVLFPLQQKS